MFIPFPAAIYMEMGIFASGRLQLMLQLQVASPDCVKRSLLRD